MTSIMRNPSYINHSSLFCWLFFNCPDRKYPLLNICLFFFQTIQIWWAMYQSQSRSWMLMTMPPILPQTALCLCVKAPRQARLVIASHSFSQCVPITLFRPVSSHLNPWNPCFSYLHFSPVLFSCPIIFSNHLFSYFNSAIQFSHMYEPTHSHVHKYYGYIYNA